MSPCLPSHPHTGEGADGCSGHKSTPQWGRDRGGGSIEDGSGDDGSTGDRSWGASIRPRDVPMTRPPGSGSGDGGTGGKGGAVNTRGGGRVADGPKLGLCLRRRAQAEGWVVVVMGEGWVVAVKGAEG